MNPLAAFRTQLHKGEAAPALWAFAWFFCLIATNYVLRPVRETIGVRVDESKLSWLYTGTFVAMLCVNPCYAWVVSRFARRTFVAGVYLFFVANLGVFCLLFARLEGPQQTVAYRAFFIWLSVFNLCAVTTFWGLLVEAFQREQGKRLFGMIAAGGTAGAIAGSLIADLGIARVGFVGLLAIAAGLLLLATFAALNVMRRAPGVSQQRIAGPILEGWHAVAASPYLRSICGYLLLFTIASTFVYFEQRALVAQTFADDASRTSYFARINYGSSLLSVTIQLFATGWLMRRFGVGKNLNALPWLCAIGFMSLGAMPAIALVSSFEVLRRSTHFAVSKPAQEVLFTIVGREQKYKAKSFVDTVVYRGGDVLAAWVYTGLNHGLGFRITALFGAGLCALWILNGMWLGRRHEQLAVPAGV